MSFPRRPIKLELVTIENFFPHISMLEVNFDIRLFEKS